jgi:hypothetical protein
MSILAYRSKRDQEKRLMFNKQMTIGRLLPAAVAVLAGCGATASAAEALTISPGSPTLTGRIAITEPVMVTCSPFDPTLTLDSESLNVQVEQAAGKAIAHGTGFTSSFSPTSLFPCDDSQSTVPITIYADPAGPPFHRGKAVFTETASAGAATPCFPGSTTCFTNPSAIQSAGTGPIALAIH